MLDSTLRICALAAVALTFSAGCGPSDTKGDSDEDPIVITTGDGGSTPSDSDSGGGTVDTGGDMGGGTDDGGTDGTVDSGGGDPDTGTDDPDLTGVTAPEVDPNCVDGKYTEALPDPTADISGFIAGYQPAQLHAFVDDVLTARYPVGAYLVQGGLTVQQLDCVAVFARNTSSAESVIGSMSTVVHECGHIYDFSLSRGQDGYAITDTLTLSCGGGDSTDRGGETFARSRIRDDEYQPLMANDPYANIYLDGDPDDDNFDGGDQGFNMLFDETVQYVNSLATSYAFQDFIRGSTSALDGILTFLWYTERYLRMARLQYPDAYAKLSGDPCWRNAILTVWGRAWWMIEQSEGNGALGINDQKLFELVRDPELLQEIQRLRDLEGC